MVQRQARRVVVLAVVSLFAGCGDDAGSETDGDGRGEESVVGDNNDAGKVQSRDAGTRDATVSRVDASNAEPEEEPAPEDPIDEPAPGVEDAGKVDAGKPDAGKQDAGKPDAGTGGTTPKPDAGAPGNTCDTLTYDSFGKSFLSTYCVSCHGSTVSQKNIRLDSLSGVQAAKAKVKAEVSSNSMPPKGAKAPSAAERTKLSEWIDCGPK